MCADPELHPCPGLDAGRQRLAQPQAVHRFGAAVVREVLPRQLRLAGFEQFQGRAFDRGLLGDQVGLEGGEGLGLLGQEFRLVLIGQVILPRSLTGGIDRTSRGSKFTNQVARICDDLLRFCAHCRPPCDHNLIGRFDGVDGAHTNTVPQGVEIPAVPIRSAEDGE